MSDRGPSKKMSVDNRSEKTLNIIKMYRAGHTKSEIAKLFNLSYSRVSKIIYDDDQMEKLKEKFPNLLTGKGALPHRVFRSLHMQTWRLKNMSKWGNRVHPEVEITEEDVIELLHKIIENPERTDELWEFGDVSFRFLKEWEVNHDRKVHTGRN